jgi:hypothetical protein
MDHENKLPGTARGWGFVRAAVALSFVLLFALPVAAQEVTIPPRADNTNFQYEPFRMIGNIYWVGHSQVGSFLIKTSEGLILMDSTSAE